MIRTTLAVLLSAGWLVPAGMGMDSVLNYLNEDMARLSLLRGTRPGFTLPTEFNAAPNIIQARQRLGLAAGWLALVIIGWSVYVLRARAALQAAQQVLPSERLGEHERALETHFTEFAHELDRHRRELTSEFGLVGEAAGGARAVVQGRFDAVDARLAQVDAALAQRLDALNTLAVRIDDSVQAEQARRQAESDALRESLHSVAGRLAEQIQGARSDSEAHHRSDQDQRFISIHNAVQVLGAQVDDKLKSTQAMQDAARSEQLGRFEAAVRELGAGLAQQQAGVAQTVQEHLEQQHERLAGRLDELGERVASSAQTLQAELTGSLEAGLAARLGERLGVAEQQQLDARDAQLAAVQALSAQLGEALQLQRDAGSEARRRAEAAIETRQETQAAQTQALAELAAQVSQLGEQARARHEESRSAEAGREQALREQVEGLMVQTREALLARSDAAQAAWSGQAGELGRAREAAQTTQAEQAVQLARLAELQDQVLQLGRQFDAGLAVADQQREAERAGWGSAVQGLGQQVAQAVQVLQQGLAEHAGAQDSGFARRHEALQQSLQDLSGQWAAQFEAVDRQRSAAQAQQRQELQDLADQLGTRWQEMQAAQARQASEQAAQLAEVRQLGQQALAQQASQLEQQRSQQGQIEAMQGALQQLAAQADSAWRQAEQQQRGEWQLHGEAMQTRLDALAADMVAGSEALGGQQAAQAERLQGDLQALRSRVEQLQAAADLHRQQDGSERQQALRALAERLGEEMQSLRQGVVAPEVLASRQQEQVERLAALQQELARLGDGLDAQREAWLQARRLEQTEQLQALQSLQAELDRSLLEAEAVKSAQARQAQQQESRFGDLQAMLHRLDEQQQSAVQHRQAEQSAMMLALERRLAAIDTLEAQVERLEGMLTRAGVQGVAARLSGIEAILSAQGPTLLEARLRKLEELLTSTAQNIDGRLGDLHGLVTQHGAFQETGPATMAARGFDERRLQQLYLNLSDLQENLRFERRQLRKKAEGLNPPPN